MHTKVNDSAEQLEIWVCNNEKTTYKTSEQYREVLENYKNLNYKISVFIGGTDPLLPTITSLLEAQKSLGITETG